MVLGLNSPVRVDAVQVNIEAAQPTSTERIRAAVDRLCKEMDRADGPQDPDGDPAPPSPKAC